ncbi:MAG: Fic family protein [Acidimicrobiia bacterium]|nr:Fic family protein [Acidimicrobiia bacterium]
MVARREPRLRRVAASPTCCSGTRRRSRRARDSALHAPASGFGDDDDFYSDLYDKAAVLTCRLVWNHPLPDGNRRAAWATDPNRVTRLRVSTYIVPRRMCSRRATDRTSVGRSTMTLTTQPARKGSDQDVLERTTGFEPATLTLAR